jgi:hypothetical protein
MNTKKIILAIGVCGIVFLGYLYIQKTNLPIDSKEEYTDGPSNTPPYGQAEADADKKKYEASAYIMSTTSTGWDIKNVEGKVLHIESGTDKNIVLTSFDRMSKDGYPYKIYSNFEDLSLSFSGTTTLQVTADYTRLPDSLAGSRPLIPVIIDYKFKAILPTIETYATNLKFCVADPNNSVDFTLHKNDRVVISTNYVNIKIFNINTWKSCTYVLWVQDVKT